MDKNNLKVLKSKHTVLANKFCIKSLCFQVDRSLCCLLS